MFSPYVVWALVPAVSAALVNAAVVILVNEGAKALRETNFNILPMRTSLVLA